MRSTLRSTLGSTPASARASRLLPVATAASLVTLAVTALGGCTGTGSSGGADADGKSSPPDGAVVSPAPPGKYRTLPQPCTAIGLDSLKKLVPGAPDYEGRESLTYDTDRLVGCSWKGTVDGSTRTLSLSVVRVVSYDPQVSAEAEAEEDFEQKAAAASIPSTPPSGGTTDRASTPPTSPSDPALASGTVAGSPDGSDGASGSASPSDAAGPAATADPSGAADPGDTHKADGTSDGSGDTDDAAQPDLAPRLLANMGNAAFINDVLRTPATGPSRTVTLVFRTANVLATITYAQSAPTGTPAPSSEDLQKSVEKVAGELEHHVEG